VSNVVTLAGEPLTLRGEPITAGEEPAVPQFATYAPRCFVHSDRYGGIKSRPNTLLVVHTSEGGELGTSAEALCNYMAQPGDRVSASGNRYGSSYQYVVDTDIMRPAVPDNTVSYSAPPANDYGIHYCIPGRAGQTRAEWLDANSRPHIAMLARALADKSAATRIPLRKLSVAQVAGGDWGVCGHHDISLAFGKSDHYDPGPQFPWDVLFTDIARLIAPPGDDDMTPEDPPRRLIDTRPLPSKIPAGQAVEVSTGVTGKAVVVNITVTEAEGPGFVTAWGTGGPPQTSNVNFDRVGQTIANLAVVPLDGDLIRFQLGGAAAHVIVDLQGVHA
jgi:hypothetical protein